MSFRRRKAAGLQIQQYICAKWVSANRSNTIESSFLQVSLTAGSISVSRKLSARIINSGGSLVNAGMLMVVGRLSEVSVAIW